jgi:NAD(P)-dependent dehydrogenase (short-subunit alcohol dehydrogenase family)
VDRFGRLDVVINNAGIIQATPIAHATVADIEDSLATHLWGPVHLVLEALPHLRRQPDARIVNITSIGGRIAVPHLLPYTVGKFALVGFSEGLRHELRKEGITVTTVSPGLMRTGSHLRAEFKGQHEKEFAWFTLLDALPGTSMDATRAARRILDASRRGEADLVLTALARAGVVAHAVAPETFARVMEVMDGLLPGPSDAPDAAEGRSGLESRSQEPPAVLTGRVDRAAARNNELPGTGE